MGQNLSMKIYIFIIIGDNNAQKNRTWVLPNTLEPICFNPLKNFGLQKFLSPVRIMEK